MSETLLTIGEVARRTGVRPSALRYYEDEGLIRPESRVGGRRRYAPAVLARLAIIRQLGDVGFTIREMRRVLGEDRLEAGWRSLVEEKLREVESRIAEANEARRLLELALRCGCERLEGCRALSTSHDAHGDRHLSDGS